MTTSLRSWTESDLPNLIKYANNLNIATYMSDMFPHPYDEKGGLNFLKFTQQASPRTILAIDHEGEAIGSVGLHPQRDVWHKNAEIGYWLAEPFWGKGIMTHTVKEMVSYGFKNFGFERIFGRVYGSNTGSIRVLEKAGFVFEAHLIRTVFKYGRFEDEIIYGIRREEHARKS